MNRPTPKLIREPMAKRLFENYLFHLISVLSEEFNPQNTKCIPLVKFFFRLELEQTKPFLNSLLEFEPERGVLTQLLIR
jgi:hypothetical protein